MEWCFNNDSGFWGLAQQSMLVLWGMFEPADHDTTSIKATLFQCFHSSHLSYPNLPSLPTFHLMFHPPFTSSPRHQPNTAACHSHTHSGLFVGGLYFIKFNAANVPSQESSELQFHFWQLNETDNLSIPGELDSTSVSLSWEKSYFKTIDDLNLKVV